MSVQARGAWALATVSLIAATFFAQARSRGGAPAFDTEGEVTSYADAARRVEARVRELTSAGVETGEVVAVSSAGHLDALTTALAVRAVGGVPLLWPPGAPPPAIAHHVITTERPRPARLERTHDSTLPLGTAWLRATGGSTGAPRLVAYSEEQLLSGERARAALVGIAPGDRVVVNVPATTGYGSMTAGLAPLLRGATLHLVAPFSPRGVLEAARAGARWTFTTAPMIRAITRLEEAGDASVVARVLVAAAPYPVAEADEARRRFGLLVYDRYGSTETGPIAQARTPGGSLHLAPGVTARFVGEPPTIEVASPHVGIGYVGGPLFEGVVRTADLVRVAPDGGFFLAGRSDRVVRRRGRAVDLEAIELALLTLPGVARARVRSAPGPLDVDLVAAVVALDGATIDAASLRSALATRLSAGDRPTRIEVIPAAAAGPPEKWRERVQPP